MSEIIPIVNEEDCEIGSIEKNKFDKTKGDIYRTVSLILLNKNREILIQRRALTKSTYAGKWDFSAVAGHVRLGETYLDAIKRETEEEIGLTGIVFKELEKTFTETADNKRRFTQIFSAVVDISISELRIPENEVAEVKFISMNELKNMYLHNSKEFANYYDSSFSDFMDRFSKIS